MKNIKNNIINPVKIYANSHLLKTQIFEENKNKSGIYRWVNLSNDQIYVGSAKDLRHRMWSYFNINTLKKSVRPIEIALLKHGHDNFKLEILEYCPESKLMETEQKYLDVLSPEYNILKQAFSMQGYKHTEETLKKLKNRVISPEHKKILSDIHSGKKVNIETREKLSNAVKTPEQTKEILEKIRKKSIEREGVAVLVINTETNEVTKFSSQTKAGIFLGVSRQAVYNAINRKSKVNNKYLIKKV